MPRQKFCSVPGCLSTTELIKREQESFLSAFCERCCIGRPCRCPAPDIYTTRKETRTKFTSWCSAIGLKDPGYYINVCYKHFSTGCPSRSCPNPDVVIPVWEKHVRDKINNVLKPPIHLKKKKTHQSDPQTSAVVGGNQRKRKRTKTFLVSLEQQNPSHFPRPLELQKVIQAATEESHHHLLLPSSQQPEPTLPAPPLSSLGLHDPTTLLEEAFPSSPLFCPELSSSSTTSFSSSSASSTSSLFRMPSLEEADDESFLTSSSALLDQSEDPCLNDGNIQRAGINFSSSLSTNASPFFGDEFESVQKWLEICE